MTPLAEGYFTPLFDTLVAQRGLVAAAVYGVVWRYCQMSDHVCKASHASIARRAAVDRGTVIRHLQALEKDGWIRDLTPRLRNAPHVYTLTPHLASLSIDPVGSSGVVNNNAETSADESGVAEKYTAVAENHTRCCSVQHPGVAQSNMNQTLLRDSSRDLAKKDVTPDVSSGEASFQEWKSVLTILEPQLSRYQFDTWLSGVEPLYYQDATLIINTPDPHTRDLLNSRLARTASHILRGVTGKELTVAFVAIE